MVRYDFILSRNPSCLTGILREKLFELTSKKCDAISCVVIIQNGGRIVLLVDRIVFLKFFCFMVYNKGENLFIPIMSFV